MPSPVEVLGTILGDVLWPVAYTLIGVFIGLLLQEAVKTERKRMQTIFRPLLRETRQVSQAESTEPLVEIRNDVGEYESILLECDSHELVQLNQSLNDAIITYIDRIANLSRYQQPHVPLAEVFVEVGYDDHLAESLPDTMITNGNHGIDPTNRPDFPGPALLVGAYTTGSGDSDYFESGYVPAVQTERRYPLFAFLLENFNSIQSAENPDDIRKICVESDEIDIHYMDANHAGWAVELWNALDHPFEPSQSIHERLGTQTTDGEDPTPLVTGENFISVARGCDMATKMLYETEKQDVIEAAEVLHNQLLHRLSLSLLNPERLLLAIRSTSVTRLPENPDDARWAALDSESGGKA